MKRAFLLFLFLLGFTGCAVSSHYVNFTEHKFSPKPKDYVINTYKTSDQAPATGTYYVIGQLELSGYASAGITPSYLLRRAQAIARKRGADAIINVVSENFSDTEVYARPGYFGRRYYHPREYVAYGDALLTMHGDLIVFTSSVAK